MSVQNLLSHCDGFEWDKNNADKIFKKHKVSISECEEVFLNLPLVMEEDRKHSDTEKRYYALGHTDAGRRLFVVFTLRKDKIRPISARDMSGNERKVYESHQERDSEI